MLSLREVSVSYDGQPAVDNVSLDLPDGEVLAVLGPSGCGKSTLLRAIAGLELLHHGSVAWDGSDLADVPTHRRGFALMFQDGQLFPHLTVGRNVGYALRLRRTPNTAARVEDLLAMVGLQGYAGRLPGRWPSNRGCCCSTSRSPPSTPDSGSGSRVSCAASCALPGRRP
jgi:thiamine transport system ATP-binding protein